MGTLYPPLLYQNPIFVYNKGAIQQKACQWGDGTGQSWIKWILEPYKREKIRVFINENERINYGADFSVPTDIELVRVKYNFLG